MPISICRRSLALAFLALLAWTPLASTAFGQGSGSAFPPGRWVPANEDVVAALYHKLLPPQPEGSAPEAPALSASVLKRAEELDGLFMKVGGEVGLYRPEVGGFPLLITGLPLDGRLYFPFGLDTAEGPVNYALILENQSEMAALRLSQAEGEALLAKLGEFRAVSVTFWLKPIAADPLDFQIGVPRALRTWIVKIQVSDILGKPLLEMDASPPEAREAKASSIELRQDLNIDGLRLGMTAEDVLGFATANGYPRPPAWTVDDRVSARAIGDCVETTAAGLDIPPDERWDWCRAGLTDFSLDRLATVEVRPHGLRPTANMLCPEAGPGDLACYRLTFDPASNRVVEIRKEDYFAGDVVVEQNRNLAGLYGPPQSKGREGGMTQQFWGDAPGPRLRSGIAMLTDGRTMMQLTLE